jgi:hypothetical protein
MMAHSCSTFTQTAHSSRLLPQWTSPLRALGKVNYIQPALPIQLADAEVGIRQVVAMLQAGHSLMLRCSCREYERFHLKVVEMVRISVAPCFLLRPTEVRL